VRDWVLKHERVYVVEQNRDGQMENMLASELPEIVPHLRSVLHYNGLSLDARTITEAIVAQEGGAQSKGADA